ncbi:ATP-binding protein [Vibrio alginolyticus]|nr:MULTISPECIES: ATP-binding protein [Vibrio]EJE4199516.1 ATP-binding protein [Vibrio cholerae]MCR9712610.1 ATP-binding protein [Vibrio parahaemolyticus]CAD7813309.1 Histidine kinase-like ATPases [Vibrio sp. B1ASS3]CAE6919626.1 Histidine kinase-like ATPases [Vibrio sp. B1ASS3]HBC3964500.1 ATP-binding protein [Vibrio parahaemolyticus]
MKRKIIALLTKSPGLKGREIAKTLGFDKKAVNSFLHHDESGTFVKNDNQWSLAIKESTVRIAKNGWLTTSDLDDLLTKCEDVWSDDFDTVRFEFSKCAILLGAVARLLCLVNQLAASGKKVVLDFSDCRDSFTYLCRVGLFETVDPSVAIIPEVEDLSCHYGQNKKVMEFVTIEANTQETNLPTKLKNAFIELAGEEHANSAFGFMSEYINNIIEHSQTSIPGVAALQVYGKTRTKVQTVFSDSGEGIVGTLRPVLAERYPRLHSKYPLKKRDSDILLLKEVLEKGGVSGARDENYKARGLGLKLSAKNAAKFDAKICVRQEKFELTLKYKDGKLDDYFYRTDLKKLEGTHICFDFYID